MKLERRGMNRRFLEIKCNKTLFPVFRDKLLYLFRQHVGRGHNAQFHYIPPRVIDIHLDIHIDGEIIVFGALERGMEGFVHMAKACFGDDYAPVPIVDEGINDISFMLG
jgi:hypothetical protein